ncbi:unnamed protein product [Caenorhabditis bovis]|uniref:NADH dehydrogenase [ubiquinone] 1 beta subcomplex subunit 3 n=1 Tax=Caenorhabditis bovis TaxID=2654633 RepID=A0A8S1F0S4_9PELO|nr:unnamed protein product [Caenorhabditis bovis]
MGGHHEPYKIPHYSIYNNYRDFPQLLQHEKRLAQLGLKDPWIRNYVYLYDRKYPHLILPGWKAGVGFAAALIILEEGYQYAKHGTTSWDAHH